MRFAALTAVFSLAILASPCLQAQSSYLGLQLRDLDAERAQSLKLGEPRGALVVTVEPDSPAEEAGIRQNDVLLVYNGETILGGRQLGRLVAETPPGRKVKLQYWRGGTVHSVIISVRAREVDASQGVLGGSPDIFAPSPIPRTLLTWTDPMLGIEYEPLEAQLAEYFGVERGALIRAVRKDSAAAKAGIKAGDIVTSIGDRAVTTPADLVSYWRTQRQSVTIVSVSLMRDHKPRTFRVSVSEKPE